LAWRFEYVDYIADIICHDKHDFMRQLLSRERILKVNFHRPRAVRALPTRLVDLAGFVIRPKKAISSSNVAAKRQGIDHIYA